MSRVHLWQSWQEDAKGPTRQAKSTTKLGLDDAPPRPALPNLNSRAAVNTRLLLVTYPPAPVLLILRHIVVAHSHLFEGVKEPSNTTLSTCWACVWPGAVGSVVGEEDVSGKVKLG